MADHVPAGSGRHIAVESAGDPGGFPVFLLHGTPGSRLGPRPRGLLLHQLGIRLITFDRPGYGDSDRFRGRSVADGAYDVAAIADACGIERFAVVGRSGGGPHALACAALLPERVTRAAVLVSLAPRGAPGLDWYEGMSNSNAVDFAAAICGFNVLSGRLTATANEIRHDPASLVLRLLVEVPEPDRRVISDTQLRSMLARNHAEGLRRSADGWIDDVAALCGPWGFAPAAISTPVLLWHGERDIYSPVGHARWLARQLPHAVVMIEPGAAHFGALTVLADVLRWAAGQPAA